MCPLCRHPPGCNNTNVCVLKLRLEFRGDIWSNVGYRDIPERTVGKEKDDRGWGWRPAARRHPHSANRIFTAGVEGRADLSYSRPWCRQNGAIKLPVFRTTLSYETISEEMLPVCLHLTRHRRSRVLLWLWCRIRCAFQNTEFQKPPAARSHVAHWFSIRQMIPAVTFESTPCGCDLETTLEFTGGLMWGKGKGFKNGPKKHKDRNSWVQFSHCRKRYNPVTRVKRAPK